MRKFAGFVALLAAFAAAYAASQWAFDGDRWALWAVPLAWAAGALGTYYGLLGVMLAIRAVGREFMTGWRSNASR